MKKALGILLVLLLIVGCSSSPSDNPKAVAQSFLNALKDANIETVNELIVPSQRSEDGLDVLDFDIADQKIAKEFTNKMFKDGFKVGEVTEDGDSAIAQVKFNGPDMGELMGKFFPIMMTKAFDAEFTALSEEEQGTEIINELIKQLDGINYKTFDSELHITKEENKWYVESMEGKNEDFLAPMMDGIEGLFGQ